MQIGMLGLGRMGGNMAQRLMRGGHSLVLYDRDQSKVHDLSHEGAVGAPSLEDFVKQLSAPRIVWVMLPAGEITTQSIQSLSGLLEKGDIVIDGGNTHYVDDVAHSKLLAEKGIEFVDSGTSGGIWGADRGYCLMIGGKRETVSYLDPVFRTLAPGPGDIPRTPGREGRGGTAEFGYIYCGPAGSGHFVKMVHNGIEYGLMQSLAEGFDLLSKASQFGYELPLADVAEVWRRGSVISSWLLDLTAIALAKNEQLTEYTGVVADSGEGRWTVEAALQAAVPCNVLTTALYARFRSRQDHTFGEKLISAMRAGFGGHVEIGKEPKAPA